MYLNLAMMLGIPSPCGLLRVGAVLTAAENAPGRSVHKAKGTSPKKERLHIFLVLAG